MILQDILSGPTAPRRERRLPPRYLAFALLGGTLIWAPITGYLRTAPLYFKSSISLILRWSGASASMNLSWIGQATAAKSVGLDRQGFGRPCIASVDQSDPIQSRSQARPRSREPNGSGLMSSGDGTWQPGAKLRARTLKTRGRDWAVGSRGHGD